MENPSSAKYEDNPSDLIEPKTLLGEELRLAREAALKVINSYSKEEALKIFLEGLKPVTAVNQEWDLTWAFNEEE